MRIACQTLPYANIFVDTSLKVIHVEWNGLVPSYIFRQTIACVVENILTRELYGCIYDLTKLTSIQQQDQDWLIGEVLPLLSDSSLRRVACLESTNRMGQLDMSDLVYCAIPVINFEFQYFGDAESALVWLEKGKNYSSKLKYTQRSRSMPFA